MNKKKTPGLVRNKLHGTRLNDPEEILYQSQLEKANGMSPSAFMRKMLTEGCVYAPVPKSELMLNREILIQLLEYRSQFQMISKCIKEKDPGLTFEVSYLVKGMQSIIDKI